VAYLKPSYESFRYAELVRRSQYNFDSQNVRPYLPYSKVEKGIMDTAATLFHLSFRQEQNVLIRPQVLIRCHSEERSTRNLQLLLCANSGAAFWFPFRLSECWLRVRGGEPEFRCRH
jgi:Peptidase family M3